MTVELDRISTLIRRPFVLEGPEAFNALALELFHLHATKNPVYRGFLEALRVHPGSVTDPDKIPFLPIQAFKNHKVLLEGLESTLAFTSSGTTGAVTSTHLVPWPALYVESFMRSFQANYGDPSTWRILALLPSYLERTGSSLVFMAEHLIHASNDPLSGTSLRDHELLSQVLAQSSSEGRRTMLLGVPYALLDLADAYPQALPNTVIMETGGMKGKRPEMVREALHAALCKAFSVENIHSEYGMTELLSQAWSRGKGRYVAPAWMQIRIREMNDPFAFAPAGRTGGINVIDLANIASCPFIATQDLGRIHADGSFEVLGRFDHSDSRGCNLMVG